MLFWRTIVPRVYRRSPVIHASHGCELYPAIISQKAFPGCWLGSEVSVGNRRPLKPHWLGDDSVPSSSSAPAGTEQHAIANRRSQCRPNCCPGDNEFYGG